MTGEQPVVAEKPLDSSTPVRLGLVVTVIALSFGVGAAHYRLQNTSDTLTDHLKEDAQEAKTGGDAHLATQLRLQRVEDAYQRTTATLERIERKLETITEQRGGVRAARGER